MLTNAQRYSVSFAAQPTQLPRRPSYHTGRTWRGSSRTPRARSTSLISSRSSYLILAPHNNWSSELMFALCGKHDKCHTYPHRNDDAFGRLTYSLLPQRDKSKWAFSLRPTVVTLGMVATQRVDGLFSVAKKSGVEKKLSLCALWDRLQGVIQMLEIEHSRLGTPAVTAPKLFQENHLQAFFNPIKQELERIGASQYCHRELRPELGGSQSWNSWVQAPPTTAAIPYLWPTISLVKQSEAVADA